MKGTHVSGYIGVRNEIGIEDSEVGIRFRVRVWFG